VGVDVVGVGPVVGVSTVSVSAASAASSKLDPDAKREAAPSELDPDAKKEVGRLALATLGAHVVADAAELPAEPLIFSSGGCPAS